MTGWTCELELASDRSIRAGSPAALAAAIGRGADLRIYTEFIFEEHIRPGGDGDPQHDGLIREVIDFRETMLVGDTRVAGVTTLRQPLEPPFGFNGTQPRMSYFLYQSDGLQACANLVLDDAPSTGEPGTRRDAPTPDDMPKMSPEVLYDQGTTGPSRNFVYDMETYRYFVRDDWEELLAADADGRPVRGSVDAIEAAQVAGRELKVGIRDLNADLGEGPEPRGVLAARVRVLPHADAGVRRAHASPGADRARGSARVPLVRVGRRVGVRPDRRPRRGPRARSLHPAVRGPTRAVCLPVVRPLTAAR